MGREASAPQGSDAFCGGLDGWRGKGNEYAVAMTGRPPIIRGKGADAKPYIYAEAERGQERVNSFSLHTKKVPLEDYFFAQGRQLNGRI